MAIALELMPLEEKPPEPSPPKTIVVKYGYLRQIGEFPSDLTQKVGCGTKLVIRTDRGTEVAEMLTTACGNGGCSKSITRDKLLSYIENSGGKNFPFSEQGRVLRVASAQDLAEQAKLDENHAKHLNMARELVTTHKLAMKIVDVEHVLGGERVLFYFVSEHRVDFRSLVRDLAQNLHTRIELRQVGARDEARLTADYEKCGQHCCCRQFLKVLTPISMRAAKVQKATLDPTKISGRCGRLMCCLRYEDQTYEELRKKLPKRNTRVRTEKGDGWVVDGQILTQLVLVQYDDTKREAVPMEKILEFDRPKPVGPDGRIMQTPNDRPPPPHMAPGVAGENRGRGPGRQGGGPGQPQQRPRPGAPMSGPQGDPRALSGPTGGDMNVEDLPPDEIADMIADAMDDGLPASDAPGPYSQDPAPAQNLPGGPSSQNAPFPGKPGPGARENQGNRPPQNRGQVSPSGARGARPPQPPQQRGPQSFRPPHSQEPGKPALPGPSPSAQPPAQQLPPQADAAPPPSAGPAPELPEKSSSDDLQPPPEGGRSQP